MLKKFLSDCGILDTVPEPSIPLAEETRRTMPEFDFSSSIGPSVSCLPALPDCLVDRGYLSGNFVRFVDPEPDTEEQAALLFFSVPLSRMW
jgi:hypothetical protein